MNEVLKCTFCLAILLGISACDSGQKEMNNIASGFEQMAKVRLKQASNTMPTIMQHAGGYYFVQVLSCGFDEDIIVSRGWHDSMIAVWGVNTNEIKHVFQGLSDSQAIGCDKHGKFVVSGNFNKSSGTAASVWAINSETHLNDLKGPFAQDSAQNNNRAQAFQFSGDAALLVTLYRNLKGENRVVTYSTSDWKIESDFQITGGAVEAVAINEDGKTIAYAKNNESTVTVSSVTGQVINKFPVKLSVSDIEFHPDNKSLLVAGTRLYNGTHIGMPEMFVEKYDATSGRLLNQIQTGHLEPINSVAIDVPRDLLVTSSLSGFHDKKYRKQPTNYSCGAV